MRWTWGIRRSVPLLALRGRRLLHPPRPTLHSALSSNTCCLSEASSSPSASASAGKKQPFSTIAAAATPPPPLDRSTFHSPWATLQRRGAKVLGSDVRRGDLLSRKGRIFQVIEAQHTQHGRGGAMIQVELRDIDNGNKSSERFRTDEPIERVFLEEKSFSFLYQEGDSIFIMDPDTFEQMEISKGLLGKASAYLKDNMTVTIQFYDGRPLSASIPRRVTCTVAEAKPYSKGQTAAPQYKRVLLDNGVTVYVPSYIKTGEMVIIDTTNDSYVTRDR